MQEPSVLGTDPVTLKFHKMSISHREKATEARCTGTMGSTSQAMEALAGQTERVHSLIWG